MSPYDSPTDAPGVGFEFRVLGPLEVLYDGTPVGVGGAGVRSVLAGLLLESNQVVPIERLIDTLWSETPPATARTIVHGYISRLRKLFARHTSDNDPEIVTRAPGYLLRVDSDRVDAHRARRLIRHAHGLEPEERAQVLSEAVSLWRGPVLADVASARLHRTYAPNLSELRLIALEERIDADLELGRHHQLLIELSTLVDQNPLRERLTAQLMLASYRAGHRAEAQARYHDIRQGLSHELGIDPGPELRGLYERLLRDDESLQDTRKLTPARSGAETVGRPTPAELPPAVVGFVGRERELGALDEMLAERGEGATHLAVVTGTAGVGKTSLAVTWARRVVSRFPDGQLYMSLRGFDPERKPLSAGEALTSMLQALGTGATVAAGWLGVGGSGHQPTATRRSGGAERGAAVVPGDVVHRRSHRAVGSCGRTGRCRCRTRGGAAAGRAVWRITAGVAHRGGPAGREPRA
jgi:DNA-binding SARP family transcriptional activator